MGFLILLKAYLKFYMNTKRFISLLALYVGVSILETALIMSGILPKPDTMYSFTSGMLIGFDSSIALITGLLGGDALSKDFSREGLFTLTQPIHRVVIMVSRYSAAILASILIIFIATFGPILTMSEFLYGGLVPNILSILLMTVLFTASMLAFVMLFSAIFSNPVTSIVMAVFAVVIIMPVISGIVGSIGFEPWFLLSYSGSSISNLALQSYPPFETTQPSSFYGSNFKLFNPPVPEAAYIMIGYLVVSLVISFFIYSRKEVRNLS